MNTNYREIIIPTKDSTNVLTIGNYSANIMCRISPYHFLKFYWLKKKEVKWKKFKSTKTRKRRTKTSKSGVKFKKLENKRLLLSNRWYSTQVLEIVSIYLLSGPQDLRI